MKKIYTLIFAIAFSCNLVYAQCGTAGANILLTTQSSIDNFATTYSGCTEVLGNLYIGNIGVTNLNGLSGITKVNGNVTVFNTSLTDLTGLGGLTTLGGNLNIGGNTTLTSLQGLNALTSVGGYVSLNANSVLTTFGNGLSGVTTIGTYLQISNHPELTNITGLNALTSIGTYIYIIVNDKLTSLMTSGNLTSINGKIEIRDNNLLTSIAGVANINSSGINNLVLSLNDVLSTCEVASIGNYLLTPSNTATISGNATGCANRTEVTAAYATTLPVTLSLFTGKNELNKNILRWETSFEENTTFFGVERSKNGISFETIETVKTSGASEGLKKYSIIDNNPGLGNTYYRLKVVDVNGEFSYSPTIAISNNAASTLSIYPVPAQHTLNINVGDRNQAFEIMDASGKTVLSGDKIPQQLDVSSLSKGIYFIKLTSEFKKLLID